MEVTDCAQCSMNDIEGMKAVYKDPLETIDVASKNLIIMLLFLSRTWGYYIRGKFINL